MPKETKSTEYLRQVIHDRIPDTKGVSLTFVPMTFHPEGLGFYKFAVLYLRILTRG